MDRTRFNPKYASDPLGPQRRFLPRSRFRSESACFTAKRLAAAKPPACGRRRLDFLARFFTDLRLPEDLRVARLAALLDLRDGRFLAGTFFLAAFFGAAFAGAFWGAGLAAGGV